MKYICRSVHCFGIDDRISDAVESCKSNLPRNLKHGEIVKGIVHKVPDGSTVSTFDGSIHYPKGEEIEEVSQVVMKFNGHEDGKYDVFDDVENLLGEMTDIVTFFKEYYFEDDLDEDYAKSEVESLKFLAQDLLHVINKKGVK